MNEAKTSDHGERPAGVRVRSGGCNCGAVRFSVLGEPTRVGVCHCLECRKATGAVSMAYADWPLQTFTRSGDTSQYLGRSFCARCGSRLFHLKPDEVEILIGALDDAPSDLVPTREGWIQRREPWLTPLRGAEQAWEDPR